MKYRGYPEDIVDPQGLTTNYNSYWRTVFLLPLIFCVSRTLILLTIFKDDPPGYYVSKQDNYKVISL